jgi:glycosyltransferase involved in cell wall biosynthesis
MNILHISALPLWSMRGKGGMPSLQETLRGHLKHSHILQIILPRYDLFSDDTKPLQFEDRQGYQIRIAECRWFPIFARLRLKARRLSSGNSIVFPARWLLNLTMLFCLTVSLFLTAQKVRKQGFKAQLIYAHNQYAALAGYLLRCVWNVPNVTRLYGTFLAELMAKPLVALRYPTATAGYLVPSSLLICANDGTRGDEVAHRFKIPISRFRFWQNGVDPPEEPPTTTRREFLARFSETGLRPEAKWVVSCSRLTYWKRIDRMIRALAVARPIGCDCQLVVAGTGDEEQALRELAQDLGVFSDVVWLGAMEHSSIWELMHVADIFMITNDVTNRCNPLYEAAWAGLPVVSVFDPSTADLLKDGVNSLLVHKEDTKSLGRNLAEVCRNPVLAEKLRQAQKGLASSFWTWDERMRVEVEELEKLVSATGHKG